MTTQLTGQFDLTTADEDTALPGNTDVASFHDANLTDSASAFTATIVWGDGTTTTGATVVGSNGAFTVEGSHAYLDEAVENASVTIVRTADGSQLDLSGSVLVDDTDTLNGHSAPTIIGQPNQALNNQIVATFSDSSNPNNTASDFTVSIDWGDGTTTGGTISGGSGTFTVSGSHSYAAAGDFTITTFMNDDFPDAASGTATTTAAIGFGGAETLHSATEFIAVPANTTVATFIDNSGLPSSDYTASIDWGDGTVTGGVVSGGAGGQFEVTSASDHTYADEGLFTLTATIERSTDHATTAASGTVTVADDDVLDATGTTLSGSPNQALTNVTVATFTDDEANTVNTPAPNAAGDFVATINWGDGTTTGGTISGSGGTFTVTGSHTYTQDGKDTITVDVLEDPSNGQATANAEATSTASIGLAPGVAADFNVAEGQQITAGTQLATFTDSNLSDTAADFGATISWGDGLTTPGTVSGGSGSFTVSGGPHTYADEIDGGLITTTLTNNVSHDTAAESGFLNVGDADVFVVTADSFTANPGLAFNGLQVATFTDAYTGQLPGDLTAAIDWGDGTSSAGTITGGGGTFTVFGSHTYTTGGQDTFKVTVNDDPSATSTASGSGTASINFAGQMVLTSATEHVALAKTTPIATFSDSNLSDTAGAFTATIDWGDGTAATAGTIAGSNGAFTIEGAHTYADEGTDPATVTLTRTADQAQTTFSGNVAVAEEDVLFAQGGGATLHSGQVSIAANFGDTPGGIAGDFIGTIDWGDGTTTAGTVSGANDSFTVSGSHTYASSSEFVATVTLADDAPGTAASSQTVQVNPVPPAGTSAVAIADQPSTGNYQIYDFGNNSLLASHPLTNIPAPWQVVGLGNFSGSSTSDMLLRNMTTGSFEIVDVSNNNAGAPISLGNVGLQVQVAGLGDFSSRPGETDMLLRDSRTGDFELVDFSNNAVTSVTSLGNVGLEVQVFGFGDFSGKPNETDMLLRNSNTDNVELVEFSNNAVSSVIQLGNLGSEWQFAGAGDFSSRPGETDMLARNTRNGDFELYDFQNGQVTAAFALGNVGLEIQVLGFADFSGNPNETDMLLRDTNNGNLEIADFRNNAVAGVTLPGNIAMSFRGDGTANVPSTGSATPAADAADAAQSSGALTQLMQTPQGGIDDWLTAAMQTSGAGAGPGGSAAAAAGALSASGPAFDASSDPIAGAAPAAALALPNPLQTHTA